jgi:cell division protein FtsZ
MTDSKPTASVKVVGVGSAGLRLLDKLAAVGFPAGQFIALDSDRQELQRCQIAERIQLGEATRRGWGCSGDVAEGVNCVRAARDQVAGKLKGADMVIIVAGMGGGMGSGGSSVVAEIASEGGALVMALALEPFDLEGRKEALQLGIQRLSQFSDTVVRMPNQRIMEQMGAGCSIQECMEVANGYVLEALMGLGRLVRSDGLLNIDFSHVRKLMLGHHGESHLVTVEIAGDARPRAAMDALLNHPFLDSVHELSASDGLIVSLIGNQSLSMDEVNEFVEHLKTAAPMARLILGVHVDQSVGTGLGVMLLVPCNSARSVDNEENKPLIEVNRRAEVVVDIHEKGFERVQQQLPLVPVSKGRFDKGEPNLHNGEDLDVPTFLRRNLILN